MRSSGATHRDSQQAPSFSYDDQDHVKLVFAKGLPDKREKAGSLRSYINNEGLDECASGIEKGVTMSIGLNIWWNLNSTEGPC